MIVAVIDDGVDHTHGDLNMWTSHGWDYIDDNYDDTYPYDSSDHGTAIAGIIGARSDNSASVAGVAGGDDPNLGAKIMSLRIGKEYWGEDQGSWAHLHMYDESVIDDAIIYAADHGAKIINMSFGCTESNAINSAISYAHNQKGVTIVAAVGNSDERQGIAYPASNMYVIAVGGIRPNWTNYGSYGSKHDKKLHDESHLTYGRDIKPISDLGYFGAKGITMPNKKPKGKELTLEQKQFNKELSKQRIKVEHSIGRMKIFQILSQRYRNDLANHSLIFKNIAGLHNLMYA